MPDVGIRATLSGAEAVQSGLRGISDQIKNVSEAQHPGLTNAARAATEVLGRMTGSLGSLADVALRATAITGGLAVGGITAAAVAVLPAIRSTLEYGESLDRLSQKTGIAVEKLGAYELLAKANQSSTEQIALAVQRLSQAMSSAADGTGKEANAFRALGISVTDTAGNLRTADAVMMDIADRFREMEDGAGKNAIATNLFGVAARNLVPVLNGGRQELEFFQRAAERAGTTMSAETAKAASEWNKTMLVLKETLRGITVQVGTPFVNWLGEASKGMREAMEAGEGFWSVMHRGATDFFRVMVFGTEKAQLQKAVRDHLSIVEEIAQTDFAAIAKRYGTQYAEDFRQGLLAQREALEQEIARLRAVLDPAFDPEKRGGKKPAPRIIDPAAEKKAMDEIIKLQDRGLANALANMNIEIEAGRATAQEKITLIDAILATDVGSNEMRLRLVRDRERTLKELTETELRNLQMVDRQWEQNAREQERIMREAVTATVEYGNVQIDEVKRTAISYEELRQRIEEVIVAIEQSGEAGARAGEQLRKQNKSTTDESLKNAERMRSAWGSTTLDITGFFIGLHGRITGIFTDLIRGNASVAETFKRIWGSILDEVAAMFAKLAANWVFQALARMFGLTETGGGGGGIDLGKIFGGGGSSLLGSLFSGGVGAFAGWALGGPLGGLLGGSLGGLFGGLFQTGGESVVSRPTLFMAGEVGPEQVSVRPLTGPMSTRSGASFNFYGPVIADEYSWRRFRRMMETG